MKYKTSQLQFAFVLLFVGLFLTVTAVQIEPQAADAGLLPELPPKFYARVVTSQLELPVDMEVLPSGDILVAEKGNGNETNGSSRIKLVPDGDFVPQTVLELSTNVYWDSGILGLEIDPNFAENYYFYVFYATGLDALAADEESTARVSRFTYDPNTRTADLASELILLDDFGWEIWHQGGGLTFDDEGHLYVGIGDLGEEYQTQNLLRRHGKVLRIKPTADGYEIPADNPYLFNAIIPPEIYAIGFRNPFRMQYVPALGKTLVADVGNAFWEEVNVLEKGQNYGWPFREGPCPKGQFQPCTVAASLYTDPLFYSPHVANETSSVTGLAYYNGLSFPETYQQVLFLANYSTDSISYVDLEAEGDLVAQPFASQLSTPVDLVVDNGRLYVVSIAEGEILEIVYQEDGQIPFSINLEAEPKIGSGPLSVTFVVDEVEDETQNWSYVWDFGDGFAEVVTNTPVVTHAYQEEGTYVATVQVKREDGLESAKARQTVVVFDGEVPQLRLTNLSDVERVDTFQAGDFLLYEVIRESGLEGLDPDMPYTWSINLYHNQHIHFLARGFAAERDVIKIPTASHDGSVDIGYEFEVTMHTADGRAIPVQRTIEPEIVSIEVASNPAGVAFWMDGIEYVTPYSFEGVIGETRRLEAEESVYVNEGIYGFSQWISMPTARAGEPSSFYPHWGYSVAIPTEDTTFTADYVFEQSLHRIYVPMVRESGQ